MAVRIESDSQVTVFAGGTAPLVTASAASAAAAASAGAERTRRDQHQARSGCAGRGEWLRARSGFPNWPRCSPGSRSRRQRLDGRDLTEIGLKGGNLTVDDQRNGKQWTFTNIDLSVTRPKGGGIADGARLGKVEAAWQIGDHDPRPAGRIIDIEAQKVSAKDLMLAMRVGEGLRADVPVGAHPRRYRARRHSARCSTAASWRRRA